MEFLNTPQAVKRFGGKSTRQATRIANQLMKQGYPYPQKVGRDWIAPVEVWKFVLGFSNKYPEVQIFYLLNTRQAAEENQRSAAWAKDLARRAQRSSEWPRKIGREWVAPREVWRELLQKRK